MKLNDSFLDIILRIWSIIKYGLMYLFQSCGHKNQGKIWRICLISLSPGWEPLRIIWQRKNYHLLTEKTNWKVEIQIMTETTSTIATISTTKTVVFAAVPLRVIRSRAIINTQEKSKSINDDSYEGSMLCDGLLQFLCCCL